MTVVDNDSSSGSDGIKILHDDESASVESDPVVHGPESRYDSDDSGSEPLPTWFHIDDESSGDEQIPTYEANAAVLHP